MFAEDDSLVIIRESDVLGMALPTNQIANGKFIFLLN
jgi:hypothetical protein